MAELRALTWNCKRAIATSGLRDYLLELGPDIVFLQEVGAIPAKVLAEYECHHQPAAGKSARPRQEKEKDQPQEQGQRSR